MFAINWHRQNVTNLRTTYIGNFQFTTTVTKTQNSFVLTGGTNCSQLIAGSESAHFATYEFSGKFLQWESNCTQKSTSFYEKHTELQSGVPRLRARAASSCNSMSKGRRDKRRRDTVPPEKCQSSVLESSKSHLEACVVRVTRAPRMRFESLTSSGSRHADRNVSPRRMKCPSLRNEFDDTWRWL